MKKRFLSTIETVYWKKIYFLCFQPFSLFRQVLSTKIIIKKIKRHCSQKVRRNPTSTYKKWARKSWPCDLQNMAIRPKKNLSIIPTKVDTALSNNAHPTYKSWPFDLQKLTIRPTKVGHLTCQSLPSDLQISVTSNQKIKILIINRT